MSDQPPLDDVDAETVQLMGAARLAYFTPVREYPPLGDKKASTLLSVTALMITVVTLFSPRLDVLVHGKSGVGLLTIAVLVGWFVTMLLCGKNAFVALTLPIPMPKLPPSEPPSLAFYKVIAELPSTAYEAQLRAMSHRRALRDMLHYNYSLAILSVEKFRGIQRSVSYLCFAFLLWIGLMLLIALGPRVQRLHAAAASAAAKVLHPTTKPAH